MSIHTRLAAEPFRPEEELAAFSSALDGEGAVVSFVGVARPESLSGKRVSALFLDHHPRLTEKSLEQISRAAADRFGVSAIRVVHRCGNVGPGEAIVFAAAASRHRRAAFEAADYLMDRLKTDAVFWKREDGPSGSAWIEPRDDDHGAAARWSEKCPE